MNMMQAQQKNDGLPPYHILFEGAELSGKSGTMYGVYDHLEKKYNRSGRVLDGCHWFNIDVGVFGTPDGEKLLTRYLDIAKDLHGKNLLFEKFHLSERVYSRLFSLPVCDYSQLEDMLLELGFCIVFCAFREDISLIEKRLEDRLRLYPHYDRIRQEPSWYIRQQQLFIEEMESTRLPHIQIDTSVFPNDNVQVILKWLGESL